MNTQAAVRRFVALGAVCASSVLTACAQHATPLVPSVAPASAAGIRATTPAYHLLLSFSGSATPQQFINVNGTLYGTTFGDNPGKPTDYGTLFGMSPQGAITAVHHFSRLTTGANPIGNLVYLNGFLYGTTSVGGKNSGDGSVYKLDLKTGQVTVLYSFGSLPAGYDGQHPASGLLYYNGTFYGTTQYGGTNRSGVVYSLSLTGKYKVLHNFLKGNKNDGCAPMSTPIEIKGVLYGTTFGCGSTGNGVVYTVTTSGEEKVLHTFTNFEGTACYMSPLYLNGELYLATSAGGPVDGDVGVLMQMSLTGETKKLHVWAPGAGDGQQPIGGLIAIGNTLYGTTSEGGAYYGGTAWRVGTNASGYQLLHSFGNGGDGIEPHSPMLLYGRALYGTTTLGGSNKIGTVFTVAL